jgi:hypothetical protein
MGVSLAPAEALRAKTCAQADQAAVVDGPPARPMFGNSSAPSGRTPRPARWRRPARSERLSASERLRLVMEAMARGDAAEVRRFEERCPRRTYSTAFANMAKAECRSVSP